PTPQQLKWHEMEFYLFTHFGPNTFTDKEWGHGDEPENIFNPTDLDCEQWCRIAKAAGAKGIIITAKHHDGFCLWPSKYSAHTVRESAWKNGKGDVLKELSQACKKFGLQFGVYLSPWDRNHPKYGTPEYNDVFVNMMKEIFTNYGPIWELWWDGANGEGPNGKKQVYDWNKFKTTIHNLSPKTLVFSDIGPHIRWVGNERGIAGKTNWNTLDTAGFTPGEGAPPTDTLNTGNINGKTWIPVECDVSIRPGWFYHKQEDDKVKTPDQLFDLWLRSVGRGANLLLNVPPDRRGQIHANDSAALMGFKRLRDENFNKDLAKRARAYFMPFNGKFESPNVNDRSKSTYEIIGGALHSVALEFTTAQKINCVVLEEYLGDGQQCKKFGLTLMNNEGRILKRIRGTTIGHKRIVTFSSTDVTKIILSIEDQKDVTAIRNIEAYLIDERLIEK
ncbi:MAG TPA: alpha-L-fucosidase, partial [Chitinophagaceae bacterium]|nr:alpha-L-fucosidase [Chitinophagaceae bacterium]